MNPQHLSDEAITAFADGVLSRHARERAARHAAACPECAYAVAVQREAVWALRAAPAPALPVGLLDRLRDVPVTTPLEVGAATVAPDGSAMFASFGAMNSAALAPAGPAPHPARAGRGRPIASAAAVLAVAGVLVIGSAGHASGQQRTQLPAGPVSVVPAGFQNGAAGSAGIAPATLHGGAVR
jgi:anti-sigma factor RsiW